MRRSQPGTLYEYNIIGVLLVVAGIVLGQKIPLLLVLVAAGILVLFLPYLIRIREALSAGGRMEKEWEKVCAAGFKPAAFIRARASEGGACLGVDRDAGKVAFVSPSGTRILELASVHQIQLKTHTLSQWGHEPRTRFDIVFIVAPEAEDFGLSFPGRREAARAFERLQPALGERVAVNYQWPA